MEEHLGQALIYLLFFLLSFLIFMAGYLVYPVLNDNNDNSQDIKFEGLNLRDTNYTKPEALQRAYEYDPTGDWVAINVKNITIERCVSLAIHECSHEWIAETMESQGVEAIDIARELEAQLNKSREI